MAMLEPSSISCGIYQMYILNEEKVTRKVVQDMIKQAKAQGRDYRGKPGILPTLIIFSDNEDKTGHYEYRGWEEKWVEDCDKSSGDMWMELLRDMGYRVDKFPIGKNAKSGNKIYMYHWYTNKKESKNENVGRSDRTRKLGGIAGQGAKEAGGGRGVRRVRRPGRAAVRRGT